MSDISHVTDDSFESEVLNSDVPVLVDYWAEWCGPCKVIAPVLEEIASEYQGKMKICKLDIDANENTPPKYGIRGIPTLMLFKGGSVEATKVGALTKSQLTAFLDSNI
ncbi:MAG: thioredoxin TrxA [Pseudomonadales bacterium]|jgi:thioredoxin 1|nr:thioredoxin TrxA [Pseudomonadales bacterium]MDP6315023.1 thioredoxin TrxA [Pseudomonadales bacterium]MDP7315828.1 thioredoxin TrxA [Pseudomonadales bacterium]|tara:strand:- start:10305 stop:10628 length:324 start_codon:yes stop_codon:yes gene_type:complete